MACNCGNCDDCRTKPYGFYDTLITGRQGVSVSSVAIDGNGDLIVSFSDGSTQNAGSVYDNQWYQNLSIQNGDAAYLNNRTYINGDATSVGGGGTTGATFTPGSMTLRYKIFGKVLFIKATLAFAITGTVQSFRLNIWNTTEFAGITPVGGEQALVYLEEAGIGTGFAFLSIGSKTSLTSGIYIRKATAGNFSAYADGSVSIIIPVELS